MSTAAVGLDLACVVGIHQIRSGLDGDVVVGESGEVSQEAC